MRKSWKVQRNVYNSITREMAGLAAQAGPHPAIKPVSPYDDGPPRPMDARERRQAERSAELERLRAIVRETLALELEE